jgi:[ribosomal protein S18]-alanine N-acetyltransferase
MTAAVSYERLADAAPADLAAIVALEQDAFSNPWTPAALAEMLSSHVTRLYVARAQGHGIIAFCACWLIEDELHINTVAVAATRRRQGIARSLLLFILEETGARRATLEVRAANDAARKLYEGLGFTETAVRPKYYSHPEDDAIILWLNP